VPESEAVALVMQPETQAIAKQEQQTITCPAHWFRQGNLNVIRCYCYQCQRSFRPLQRAEVAQWVIHGLIASVTLHNATQSTFTLSCGLNVVGLMSVLRHYAWI